MSTELTAAGAASLTWDWSISLIGSNRPGSVSGGTFTTGDAPDSDGFYTITALTGERQGVAILRLQSTGTAIPDNAPYAVDNRVRPAHPDGQLTKAGFGFELANGWFQRPMQFLKGAIKLALSADARHQQRPTLLAGESLAA